MLVRCILGALVASSLSAGELHFDLIGSLRGGAADGDPAWLEGGWGKGYLGGDAGESTETRGYGSVQLGLDWRPVENFGIVINGVARAEPSGYGGRDAGLVEAFAEGTIPFREADRLRIRAGMFFLPTSRENSGPMWSSPYSMSFSAINTWIGEEVRPIGLDLDYRIEAPVRVSIGATAFGGNDTMGTLVGWRGWAMHDRLTVYDEVLPLPDLWSLDAAFPNQRKGTTPFRDDLDGEIGWSGRIRIEDPERWTIQYARVDNRGDRARYLDEYSWETDFHLVGLELRPRPELTFAGEYLTGYTAMGRMVLVELEMESAYLLGSWEGERWRGTLRGDWMQSADYDGDIRAELNDEDGSALTAALFWSLTPSLRLGAELMNVDAERVSAAESGYGLDVGGTTATVELRWSVGRSWSW